MSNVLEKHAKTVISTDIQHDGVSYLDRPAIACDWVITNPPYNLAFEFVQKALSEAKVGVAMFLRATFLEGNKRYKELYKDNPPSTVGIFTRRVGLKKNVVDVKAGSAVMYAWIVWEKEKKGLTSNLIFIPPCNLD